VSIARLKVRGDGLLVGLWGRELKGWLFLLLFGSGVWLFLFEAMSESAGWVRADLGRDVGDGALELGLKGVFRLEIELVLRWLGDWDGSSG
jgi:hypothetical protein